MLFDTSTQNPLGLTPGSADKVRVTMRGGAGSKGQVVRFDVAASDGDVTASLAYGMATNPTANVLAATNSHNSVQSTVVYFYGVLAEDIADDAQGWAYIRGDIEALGGDTSAAGTGLSVGAGSELIACTDGSRIIAVARETLADGVLGRVWFDGIHGFGFNPDVAS